mmetsp:Transcript_34221/g.102415  ORF Transcript_34221/g.102415 Transcript_34221/m.102415 type:complete len:228 (-) Transcript_34221:2798-3481(-)
MHLIQMLFPLDQDIFAVSTLAEHPCNWSDLCRAGCTSFCDIVLKKTVFKLRRQTADDVHDFHALSRLQTVFCPFYAIAITECLHQVWSESLISVPQIPLLVGFQPERCICVSHDCARHAVGTLVRNPVLGRVDVVLKRLPHLPPSAVTNGGYHLLRAEKQVFKPYNNAGKRGLVHPRLIPIVPQPRQRLVLRYFSFAVLHLHGYGLSLASFGTLHHFIIFLFVIDGY